MSSAAEINGRQTQPSAEKAEEEPRAQMERSMLGLTKHRKGPRRRAEPGCSHRADPALLHSAQSPARSRKRRPGLGLSPGNHRECSAAVTRERDQTPHHHPGTSLGCREQETEFSSLLSAFCLSPQPE